MGNKRKFLDLINNIVIAIENREQKKLIIGEGFSGSGVVSRLFKTKAKEFHVNDLAGYSYTLNKCYLSTPSQEELQNINDYINQANNFVNTSGDNLVEPWIQKHWAPNGEITKKDRVYFTEENAKRIDKYRSFISKVPKKYRYYLLAPLLVECSIHNNTNGQFSAFYKNELGIGQFGGKKNIDLKRITKKIVLPFPVLSTIPCPINISRADTNEWIKKQPEMDLVYYDPPYNKHPYSIYYFLLDIINDWKTDEEIPDTNRGQPKTWVKSKYNSTPNAKDIFNDLIKYTKSKYILISYNSGGIIPLLKLEEILEKYGHVEKIPFEHKTYNKLRGIANYKRQQKATKIKEFLWLLQKY